MRSFLILATLLLSNVAPQMVRMVRLQFDHYTIEYPADRPRLGPSIAQTLRSIARLPALPAEAPAFGQNIQIILAASDAHFDSLTGGAIPEWGAGVADSRAGVIIIPGYGGGRASTSDISRVLRHELAHIALHRYLSPNRIPRWFNEGYATWSASELDFAAEWQLRVAFAKGTAPPLDSLELMWPRATADARLAYLLSASVVAYLVRESGEDALALFLQRWRSTQDIDQALATTYGLSIDQLETHWVKDVRERYGWFAVLAQSAVFMGGAAVLFLIMFAIRRRRDRKKLAFLRANEPPDLPAYWEETEDPVDDPPGKDDN
jgi:hypothetical protein